MNHDNSRSRREITELAWLLPAPAMRDLPAGREQILKEHLMSELRRVDETSQPAARERRVKRFRPLLAAAGAGLVAIVTAVSVVVTTGHQQPTSSGPAIQLLAMVATAAASQPAPVVRDGDFMYIRSEVAYEVDSIVNGHETSTMEKRHERQVWLPVADICVTGLLTEEGSSTPLSPFPVVNGKVDRSGSGGLAVNFTCPSEGHLGDATYRLMQSIPTDPQALLQYLQAGKKWTNDGPAQEIGDLIREAIVPPALSAALYRTAELLPGATLVPDAVNAVGRHGVGIAWDTGDYRTEWIFDKTTLQYIGERDFNVKTGVVNGESAITQSAFVSKAGQLP
jgi:hypothetical protein